MLPKPSRSVEDIPVPRPDGERSESPGRGTSRLRAGRTDRRPFGTRELLTDAGLQPDRPSRLASCGPSPNSRTTGIGARSHSQVRESLNRQQIAALVGVAPMNRDSGTQRRQRHIQGGQSVRNMLCMATLTARTCNPLIRATARRLTAAGKPFKVMMTACLRKLLTLLNTIVRTRQPWRAEGQSNQ